MQNASCIMKILENRGFFKKEYLEFVRLLLKGIDIIYL